MYLFEVSNVTKSFKKGIKKKEDVLKGISFKINPSEKVAIVGANGSGKSTLLYLLSNLYKPSCGTISYKGKPVVDSTHMSEITYCMSNFYGLIPEMRVKKFLKYKGINLTENEFTHDLFLDSLYDKKISFLSSGEKQRVNLAGSFLSSSDTLIFDEPTSNLDIVYRNVFLNLLRKMIEKSIDKTIILVSHWPLEIIEMDRMIVLKDGYIHTDEKIIKDPVYIENKIRNIFIYDVDKEVQLLKEGM